MENNIEERYQAALDQKINGRHTSNIINELTKKDWQDRKAELDKLKGQIQEIKDFEKYHRELDKLFEDLIELITAPGVDEFMNWLNGITNNINETYSKRLRRYLVSHFSEESISTSIENILNEISNLEITGTLFSDLMDNVKKEIKKESLKFINKPTEYENAIDGFLSFLTETLEGLSEIDELSYTSIDQLKSDEQKLRKIDFYDEIIINWVKTNQEIKPIDDAESGTEISTRIRSRIKAIKDCITSIYDTGIANSDDESLKSIFLKFSKEMVKFDGGILNNFNDFIENKWNEIEDNYHIVSDFFDNQVNINSDSLKEWAAFGKFDRINSILVDYKSRLLDNPLNNIHNQKNSDLSRALSKKALEISNFQKSCNELKSDLMDEFDKRVKEYEDKNIPLISIIAETDKEIKEISSSIEEQLVGLINAKLNLEKSTNILEYLDENFSDDLLTYNEIRNKFNEALLKSGRSKPLEWLDNKLDGSNETVLNSTDLDDTQSIIQLLKDGLIKITIEKQF